MLIASAKSWGVRGASHLPAFMGSCLTISHTCLLCLPSERVIACVLSVIKGIGDAGGAVNVRCGWVGGQRMEFVTANWCFREVVEPRSDCKKTYLW